MRHAQSLPSVAFAMAISLTLFACSDSSSGDDNEEISSSSTLTDNSSSSVAVSSSSSIGAALPPLVEYWNPNIEYGTLDDERDDKTYRTVEIGTQTWMAENLNFATESGSWCYNNNTVNCTTYGRLYDWETALTACPTGWHLPSDAEWATLTDYVGSTAGTKLKAKSGWNENGNGTDDYGFSALPGGSYSNGYFYDVGSYGYWWSATEANAGSAYSKDMYYRSENVGSINLVKGDYWSSVRCLRD